MSGIHPDSFAKEAQVRQQFTDGAERFDYATPSYLYPHAWPPGTEVPRWAADSAPPLLRVDAVIGDKLRVPALWCEFGECIARFTDPDALGMRDVRARAAAAGWRQDAFGRLACPRCQQTDPAFRATHPVVPWSSELRAA